MSPMRYVIVDVDVGLDDYLALMMLIYAQQEGLIKILAIICSAGNTSVGNTCRNTLRLLEIIGQTKIPVYKGVSERLVPLKEIPHYYGGKDGFGDLEYEHEPDTSIIQNEIAANALGRIVKSLPNQVDLICLAPLTNIALAAKLHDDFMKNIRGLYIMGGNRKAFGNTTCSAEYNFYFDPEAAYVVLKESTHPTYILPWETCLKSKFPHEWRFKTLSKIPNPAMQLLTKVEEKMLPKKTVWTTCDPLLIMAYLFPDEGITKSSNHNATVELHGTCTRGQLVLDHLKEKMPNVIIIENINENLFKKVVEDTVKTVK